MIKEKAMMIAEQINTANFNSYEATRIYAEVIKELNDFTVEVKPAETNDSRTCFYQISDMGNIEQGYNVHAYAKIENGEIIVRIW